MRHFAVEYAVTTIGIIGAGKVGTVLARLALSAGYRVLISGSGPASKIELIVDVLAPGAVARTTAEVIADSDILVLALPLGKIGSLPAEALAGKLVIDAANYWEPVDGPLPEFRDDPRGTSEIVAEKLPGARIVKGFSHLGYHDLDERGRPAGDPDRVALAIAGDDEDDVARVAGLVNSLGFDPVIAGPLTAGRRFQAFTPVFGVPMPREELGDAVSDLAERAA